MVEKTKEERFELWQKNNKGGTLEEFLEACKKAQNREGSKDTVMRQFGGEIIVYSKKDSFSEHVGSLASDLLGIHMDHGG
jgi:hypothetical protein